MKQLFKITLGLMAISGLMFAGCKKSSTSPNSSAPPTITLHNSSLSVADAADTTVTINVHADAGIQSVTADASSGTATIKNVQGVGSADGTADLEYKAPQSDGSYTVTVTVTDKNNQSTDKKLDVTVSASQNKTLVFNEGDKISGTWKMGQQVEIKGNVIIDKGQSLTIEPGVTVIVDGDGTANAPDITVMGSLYSYGTKAQPVTFTVPQAKRTAANMFAGLWGGILGTSDSPAMVFEYTNIEYVGAPAGANDPIVLSGELNEGDPRYGLFYDNINGYFILEHSRLSYTIDDGIRVRGGKMLVDYNTFEQTGTTGGESINIKSGVTGILAYNLTFESSTNGLKWSNAGNTNVQTDVDCYNNTTINSGWRRTKTGRGGSINIEVAGRGKIYNNLIVDCKYGVRLVPKPNNPDTANVDVGWNYMYGSTQGEVNEFYPTNGTLYPGEYNTSHDIAGGVGANDPKFVNFDVTKFDSTEATDQHPQLDPSWDFHLQSGSPALGKGHTGWTPVLTSVTVNGKTYKAPDPSNFIGAFGTE